MQEVSRGGSKIFRGWVKNILKIFYNTTKYRENTINAERFLSQLMIMPKFDRFSKNILKLFDSFTTHPLNQIWQRTELVAVSIMLLNENNALKT